MNAPAKVLIVIAGLAVAYVAGLSMSHRMASNNASAEPAQAAPAEPTAAVKVLSIKCSAQYGSARADISAQNMGRDLSPAQVFVSFNGQVADGFLFPTELPSGSVGTTTIFAKGSNSTNCAIVAIQDGRTGEAVKVTQ